MKTYAWILGAALLLGGCSDAKEVAEPSAGTGNPIPAAQQARGPLIAPDFDRPTLLGIANRKGVIRAGASLEEALSVFVEPPGSFESFDLPPSVTEPYEARGWQLRDEGFGAILFKGRVAAALYQLDQSNEERLQEILALQRASLGPPSREMEGKFVRYWFWSRDNASDSTMLCATQYQKGKINIALATGVSPLMEALGMTEDAASRDRARAERLMESQKDQKTPNRSPG